MSDNSLPAADGDVPNEGHEQNTNVTAKPSKQSKKSKKHSKSGIESKDVNRVKSKKHKKIHESVQSDPQVLPLDTPTGSIVKDEAVQQPSSSEPVKKKKKHAKDGSKHKKISQTLTSEVTDANLMEVKHKHTIHDASSDQVSDIRASTAKHSKISNAQQITTRTELQDDSMIPISPELMQHSVSASPQTYRSPPSSGSHCSSRGSRSPYSRSPSHRTSGTHHYMVPSESSRRLDTSRDRYPRRGRFDDPRHINPRRTYVGYRRPSVSRDNSPEEYYADQLRSDRRRSRSRRSPGTDRSLRTQGGRRTINHQRILSPVRGGGSRRYHRLNHSRSRSPPEALARRRREDEYRREHRSPRKYSRSSRDRVTDFRTRADSREDASEPHSRTDRRAPTPEHGQKLESTLQDSPSLKRSERGKDSSYPRKSRAAERSRSRDASTSSGQLEKRSHRKMRSSKSSDRSGRVNAPQPTEPSRERSSVSRSPKPTTIERTRKSKSSSKVRAVLSLLGELGTDGVSDTELDSVLPPDVLSAKNETELDSGAVPISTKTHLDKGIADEGPSLTTGSNAVDADVKGHGDKNLRALSSLENLSSQLRKKLSEPEQWDDALELSPTSDHETDIDEESSAHQSLVTIATSRKCLSHRPELIATLLMPWQDLIKSADSSCAPEAQFTSSNLITPMMRPGCTLDSFACDVPLLSIQNRACGALALRQIGVSKRYLGEDLLNCLNAELANVGSDLVTDCKTIQPQLGQTEIAWMQRNAQVAGLGLASTPRSGLISCMSDTVVRQQLLELAG